MGAEEEAENTGEKTKRFLHVLMYTSDYKMHSIDGESEYDARDILKEEEFEKKAEDRKELLEKIKQIINENK